MSRWRRSLLIATMLVVVAASATWVVFRRQRFDRTICHQCFWRHQSRTFESALIEMYSAYSCPDDLCRAETAFLLGNVLPNDEQIRRSMDFYRAALRTETNLQRRLLVRLALGMGGGRAGIDERAHLRQAASLADVAQRNATAALLRKMREGDPPPRFGDAPIDKVLTIPPGAAAIVLGASTIPLADGMRVGVQLERTFRDWLSYQMRFDFRDSSLTRDQTLDYHEGARLRDIMDAARVAPVVLAPAILAKRGEEWLAPDERGVFRFRVLDEKVWYPTTKRRGNYALMTDTNGVASVVEPAVAARVRVVLACGDTPSDAAAAFHLARRGVHVYMPCDRFIGDLIGHQGTGVILGTAPVASGKIGGRPVTISFREAVVVGDATPAGLRYYDAPARYFRALAAAGVPLSLHFVTIEERQTGRLIAEAERTGAGVIATRVQHAEEYAALRAWLTASSGRRAVLFHSALYPAGMRLFEEFPDRVTFGDPRPRFVTSAVPAPPAAP